MTWCVVATSWVRRALGCRHAWRGQGSLEYGLLVATIAIVAAAGFKALSSAETAYFTGLQPSLAPTPPAFSPLVVQHDTQTTVTCSQSSVFVGTAVSCTATVTDIGSGSPVTPTGSVTWSNASAPGSFTPTSCTGLSGSGASATCATSYLPTGVGSGVHTLTAAYSGDPAHKSSSGSFQLAVALRSTGTSVSCSPASVSLKAQTDCTITVTDTSSVGATSPPGTATLSLSPAGSGTFTNSPCSLTGTGSSATCHILFTPTSTGTFTVTASYAPSDAIHASCTSGSSCAVGTSLSVTARSSGVSVSCANSFRTNVATTCTAQVSDTDNGTSGVPTGSVVWSLSSGSGNFSNSATCTLNPSGACSLSFTPSSDAPVTLGVAYGGDATYRSSSGSLGPVAVAARATQTDVQCAAPYNLNAPITCTATVSDKDTAPQSTPAGTVTWSGGSGAYTPSAASCTLSSGTCSVTFTPNSSGSQTLTAAYRGDDSVHAPSSGAVSFAVLRPTSTTVTCTPSSAKKGTSVTCTATVQDGVASGATTPTGTVTWTAKQGSFSQASCALSGAGATASCSVTYTLPNAQGQAQTVTATYAGDAAHNSSAGSFNVTVSS